jgi:Uma2 family endonuclease
MTTTYDRFLSMEDYLKVEETSRDKHEYVAGHMYAMSGASMAHETIILNLGRQLYDRVRDSGCHIFVSNMKVRVVATQSFYYPDVIVTCERMKPKDLHASAPSLIIEVLSPATATIDRREKLIAYRQLPSLREYVIVHQDKMRVEIYRQDENGEWPCDKHEELDGIADFTLRSLPGGDLLLSTESIYRNLDFTE